MCGFHPHAFTQNVEAIGSMFKFVTDVTYAYRNLAADEMRRNELLIEQLHGMEHQNTLLKQQLDVASRQRLNILPAEMYQSSTVCVCLVLC